MANEFIQIHDIREIESVIPLPMSLQKMMEVPNKGGKKNQAMTMKELDCKLNALRRENFDLKLRLYLEKQNKGHVKADVEPIFAKDAEKKEKALKELNHLLFEKENQILKQKEEFEKQIKEKNFEIELLTGEKNVLLNEVKVTSSLCKSFMICFNDMRNFWVTHSQNFCLNQDLVNSLHHWLNNSEALLNSASVLIDNEYYDETFVPKNVSSSYFYNPIQSKKNSFKKFGLTDYNAKEYSFHKQLLYNESSDSEDDWSEPDREVSKSRIGLSFYGLTTEIDEKVVKRSKHYKKLSKTDQSAQTILELPHLDNILKHSFKKQQNKQNMLIQTDSTNFSDHLSQTESIEINHQNIQTNLQTEKQDKIVETDKISFLNISTQTENKTKEFETKIDFKINNSNLNISNHNKNLFNSSPQLMENFSKKIKSSTPQTLYTYKAVLSPLNESYSSESSQITHCSNFNNSEEPFQENKHEQNLINFSNFINENQPYDQLKLQSLNDSINSSNVGKKPFIMNKVDESIKLSKLDKVSTNKDSLISSSSSLYSSFSESYHQKKNFKPKKLIEENEMKEKSITNSKLKKNYLKDYELHEFSSPDLGIGDSDHDLNSSLRAYVKLSYYQLLFTNLNQISSHLNSLEKLNKNKFFYQLVQNHEYIKQIKSFFNNFKPTTNCSKSAKEISLFNQFEDFQMLKKNIGKAITKQLKKTDKLLKKAKLNIKNY